MKLIPVLLMTCAAVAAAPVYISGSPDGWIVDHVLGELREYQDNRTSFTSLYAASPLAISDNNGPLMTGTWGVADDRFAPYGTADGVLQEQLYLDTFTSDAMSGVFFGLISPRFSAMIGLNEAQHHLAGLLTIGRSYDIATGESATWWNMVYTAESVTHAPEPATVAMTAAVLLYGAVVTLGRVRRSNQ